MAHAMKDGRKVSESATKMLRTSLFVLVCGLACVIIDMEWLSRSAPDFFAEHFEWVLACLYPAVICVGLIIVSIVKFLLPANRSERFTYDTQETSDLGIWLILSLFFMGFLAYRLF